MGSAIVYFHPHVADEDEQWRLIGGFSLNLTPNGGVGGTGAFARITTGEAPVILHET